MTRIQPDADPRAYRDALGTFATGVTVITASGDDGPVGITANSFSSVSLDPPLVLWSPAKASRRFAHFAEAPRFAIHVLRADQHWIGEAFTRSKTAFDEVEWEMSQSHVPLISGVLACFECNFETLHDAGDHAIVLGRVIHAHLAGEGQPLVFHGGRYGRFTPDD